MIDFKHKLPSMNIDGKKNGTYNNWELAIPGVLTTTDPKLGIFLHTLRKSIQNERTLVFVDDIVMMCCKNWIRDHVHIMKAFKHWEYELGKFLNFIINTQRDDGQYYELIKQMDDEHWKFVDEDCYVKYEDDNLALVRLELEADVEYLVVEGAMQYFRVTSDIEWLKSVLPSLEKAINYMTTSEKRWDKEHGLVKRAFTIDTWDFACTKENPGENRRIEKDEKMSIMHGDNSGIYQAMNQLAWMNRRLGNEDAAVKWEKRAEEIKANMFKYLWNGRFFIHQLHLNHEGLDNLEGERISLSNSYDINRGVTNTEQTRSVIDSYRERKESAGYFAEWFTIDPPYENFCGYKKGQYVNGAVSPFTAGELAKAAFNCGYEKYGWDIIMRFIELAERDDKIYFLYFPDSSPQPDGGPSAWGAAALLSAVDEGLAGIVDADCGYSKIDFSPRFVVTYYDELRYITGYEKTGKTVDVKFILDEKGMRYDITSPAKEINAHILLPEGKTCKELLVNGEKTDFELCDIYGSIYVDKKVSANGTVSFEIIF